MAQTVMIDHLGISIEMLRKLVFLIQDATVRYDQTDGAKCPLCHRPRARVYCSKPPIRSHKCTYCGTRFKSVEHPIA